MLETLAEAKGDSGTIVVLTGAGISAESGIPTFRGKEGYWTVGSREYHPMDLATRSAFGQVPRTIWNWYLYRRGVCRAAEPNAGHISLVQLEQALGERFVLVTQNIDGLHLRCGNTLARTHQIHGNIDYSRCAASCTTDIDPLPEDLQLRSRDDELSDDDYARLRCPRCDGLARPHVLWFDECYDEPRFRASTALRAAARADLLVVVGTSGSTNLPMQIGMLSARRGIPIIDINPDDGPFGELAGAVDGFELRGTASAHLPPIVDALSS